jgi:hypothetical protein
MDQDSIVDFLKSRGKDSSFQARQNLATLYGIVNYTGSAEQNTELLAKLGDGHQLLPPLSWWAWLKRLFR